MFTRPEGLDWFVNIRPTMLDVPAAFAPFIETWTGEKLAWVRTPAVHSFEVLPPVDAYEGLIKGYSEWPGRAVREASGSPAGP
jgi:hypothetical protein